MPQTPKTMTAGELRKLLEGVEDDTLVGFAHPAHDYWHTTLLGEVRKAEVGIVKWSESNRSFVVLDAEAEEKEENVGDLPSVLVLS